MRQISSKVAYENEWMTIHEDVVERVDGSAGLYFVMEKRHFATVLPRGEGGFWMVEQYRYPIKRRAWEFPGGGWPHGVQGDQEALARTELAEETGLRADRLEHLGFLYQAYAYGTQGCDIYLATGLTAGRHAREATELDMVQRLVPDDEIDEMIRDGRVIGSMTVACLALYRLHVG